MSHALTRSWISALPMAALFIDTDDRIIALNKLSISLFGEGLIGRSYATALRDSKALKAIQNCFQSKTAQRCQLQRTQGRSETWLDFHCAYIGEGFEGVLVTLNDVTAFEKTSQLHRDFVANVSHELRTPLTALAGFIETLQGPAKADAKGAERFLQIMSAETARMNRLVEDLLALSRVEAQERQRPTAELALDSLLGSVVQTFTEQARAINVELALKCDAKDHMVFGDGDQLRQVFGNLLENALKYGGELGVVTIMTSNLARDQRLLTPAICITVADTGDGFDPIHIPRLTDRFYRIDDHRSRETGGTGLGLAITKHIISRHRGRLEIQSFPSQGSEFRVILPLRG